MENFLRFWFTPDAVAVYVTTIAILVAGWGATWYMNKRGNRIVVTRLSTSPQINISARVRENLQIKYKGAIVNELVLNVLKLENQGSIVLRDIRLLLYVSPIHTENDNSDLFIEVEAHDKLNQTEILAVTKPERVGGFSQGDWIINIHRPFLNHKSAYPEEEISIIVFSNREIEFTVTGGGEGWYARYFDRSNVRDVISRFAPVSFLLGAFSLVIMILGFLILLIAWVVSGNSSGWLGVGLGVLGTAFMSVLFFSIVGWLARRFGSRSHWQDDNEGNK